MVGCYPQVVLQLSEDVLERWRRLDAARYREAEAMCLACTWVWVLAEDHDLHVRVRREM